MENKEAATAKPESNPIEHKSAIQILADLVVKSYSCEETRSDNCIEVTPQELLLTLCTTEPPSIERVDDFIKELRYRNANPVLENLHGKLSFLYLLKPKL